MTTGAADVVPPVEGGGVLLPPDAGSVERIRSTPVALYCTVFVKPDTGPVTLAKVPTTLLALNNLKSVPAV